MKKVINIIFIFMLLSSSIYFGIKFGLHLADDRQNNNKYDIEESGSEDVLTGENDKEESDKNESSESSETSELETEDIVNKYLRTMSLEEKVGQLFIVAFRTNLEGNPLITIDDYTRNRIEKYNPGGVVLFSQNIDTIQQTKELIDDFKAASKTPMFIAIDEEGGKVSRLNSSSKMHATKLPGNQAIGKTGEVELAYRVGVVIAEELSSLGFNMNFAPVADVNTNPKNTVIGSRSFGTEPEMVGDMVAEMVKGMQSKGISSVLKHFPGHGDTSQDSHDGATISNHNRERLEDVEFIPFNKGIEAGVDGIMSAHIQIPEITGESIPATLSEEVLTGILRNDMNFNKLIITDALEMKAISKYWSSGEAAVAAFKAGTDILLMPAVLSEAYDSILNAVNAGEISLERLDDSVRRILTVKNTRNVLNPIPNEVDAEKVLGNPEHLELAREIKEFTASEKK